ncbi:alpha-L-fucosidase [Aestuariibaculum suncheonense]|uniref:alpha-L-fucosidase n=1 Tax=Aestuariibaculum suncheonense TaxID=1028745 RepID=A0A8J6UAZ9_9FLAO|nr:alpha-L-fucosidase [Aestuariibaculum suncheonense]MBD0835425.1 alpha-L-fucosidase [Aestuariibaculum suncheonense]
MKKILLTCLIFIIGVTGQLHAQEESEKEVKYGQITELPRQDDAMKKWRSNRFGQFIHWGLYAIPGGVWKGKTYEYAAEFLKSSAGISTATWDSLQYQFNPIKFNAMAWAKMAKAMGVKYATITTKHHEGFCLWPSEYTDFDIENTPYGKDLLGEFIEAYNAEGIDVSLYYSVLDWHHPDWRYKLNSEEDKEAFERLKIFTKNQLLELLDRYPTVKGLWFDGTWDQCWKDNGQFSYELEKKLKEKHPGLVVNSRMRADEYGSRHFDSNGVLMGDYESGYERRLPNPWDIEVTKNDWECCMTIPENQWGYHKDWTLTHIKTANELIEMLVQCTSQNGNFLLNFGPTGEGDFREEEVKLAKEIGDWMDDNSSAIYNCGYAGLKKQGWGYFTQNNDSETTINMVVFNKPINGKYRVKLNKGSVIKKAYLLSKPDKALDLEEISNGEYFIEAKKVKTKDPFVIIIELENKDSKKFHQKALT